MYGFQATEQWLVELSTLRWQQLRPLRQPLLFIKKRNLKADQSGTRIGCFQPPERNLLHKF